MPPDYRLILIILNTCFWFSVAQDEWFPDERNCGRASKERKVGKEVGVFPSPLGSAPWHASVYKIPPSSSAEMTLVCSGTIITKSHILTAASCVFINDCTSVDPDPFRVKVALDRQTDVISRDVQQRDVKHAKVDNYSGESFGYQYNVAILFLSHPLVLNDYVMPICIDWAGKTPPKIDILEGTSWGFDNAGIGSEGALVNGIFSTKPSPKCRKEQSNLKKYLTHDKFCLSTPRGRRREDAGAGLVYRFGDRYYLKGILSVMANQVYSPVTNATRFLEWFKYAVKRLDQERKCEGKFPCVMGPCIELDEVCNGHRNCPDGSDESGSDCVTKCVGIVKLGLPPKVNGTHCVLPAQLGGSKYRLLNCKGDCEKVAGTPVNVGTTVVLECGHGTTPSLPDAMYACIDGFSDEGMFTLGKKWFPHEPLCLSSCQLQTNKNTKPVRCEMGRKQVSCDPYLLPGTSVKYNCSDHYEMLEDSSGTPLFPTRVTCLENGIWSDQPPECVPRCGVKNSAKLIEPTIAYGKPANIGDFPWQVALYSRKDESQSWDQICGGTILLYPHIILTAAHCLFWEVVYGNNLKEASQLRVGAGKIYRGLQPAEFYQQEANVKEIIVHEEYTANRNGASLKNDIALLILEKPFVLTDVVLPSCIDYHYRADYLAGVSVGRVAGWGYTEKNLKDWGRFGVSSNELLYTSIKLHANQECRTWVENKSPKVIDIVTYDKFCGFYTNGSGPQKGDSGGGLVIRDRARQVSIVIGIVSTKPSGSDEFGTFTSVGSHKSWLQKNINLHRPFSRI